MLLLCSLPTFADDISLGYCDGGNTEQTLSGMSQVAALFPYSEFPMYQGAEIIGVRLGVASDVAGGVKIFIRDKVGGKTLLTYTSPSLYKGWNDVYFDKRTAYPATDLCVGFETPAGVTPCVSGQTTPNSCFAYENGQWTDLASQDEQPLCVELLVDGDSYTRTDGALLSADSTAVGLGKAFAFTGRIRNNTNQTLSSARMSYDLGDGAHEADATVDDVLPGETGAYSLPVAGVGTIGLRNVKLRLVSLNGVADEYDFNNIAYGKLNVVGDIVKRKVLVEAFTGQECVSCPSGHEQMAEALKDETDYVEVAHHWGFGTDDFTAPGSTELTWFFNDSQTYAPGLMVDRFYWELSNKKSPVSTTPRAATIKAMLTNRLSISAPVDITLKRNYDAATRQLTIQVGMKKIAGMELGSNPVLTVDLVENGLHGRQEGSTNANYEHNKVNRMFVTEVMGESVNLSESDYTYATYKADVDSKWNADNMEIVAFVSNYDKADPTDCEVYNAAGATLEGHDDITTGVAAVGTSTDATVVAIYSVDGTRLSHKQKGINILRFSDGTTRKVME